MPLTLTTDLWSGRVSRQALAQIREVLSLRLPVRVKHGMKYHSGEEPDPGLRGRYEFDPVLAEHMIYVARHLTREEANESILHELRHAYQNETLRGRMGALYQMEDMISGYEDNFFEKDARAFASFQKTRIQVAL